MPTKKYLLEEARDLCWDLITETGLRGAGAPCKLGKGRSARAKMCRLGGGGGWQW